MGLLCFCSSMLFFYCLFFANIALDELASWKIVCSYEEEKQKEEEKEEEDEQSRFFVLSFLALVRMHEFNYMPGSKLFTAVAMEI